MEPIERCSHIPCVELQRYVINKQKMQDQNFGWQLIAGENTLTVCIHLRISRFAMSQNYKVLGVTVPLGGNMQCTLQKFQTINVNIKTENCTIKHFRKNI